MLPLASRVLRSLPAQEPLLAEELLQLGLAREAQPAVLRQRLAPPARALRQAERRVRALLQQGLALLRQAERRARMWAPAREPYSHRQSKHSEAMRKLRVERHGRGD